MVISSTKTYKMKKLYVLITALFSITSCTQLSYIGTTGTPTKNVDVFVTPEAITRPYVICGKAYPQGLLNQNPAKLQIMAVNMARKKGADAVLITDYYSTPNAYQVNSYSRSDSTGKSIVSSRHSIVTPANSLEFTISFIKYIQQ